MPGDLQFHATPIRDQFAGLRGRTVHFIGNDDYVADATQRLRDRVGDRTADQASELDMRPFEILRDMLLEESRDYIGGAPQAAKVYQHQNAELVGVRW